MIKRQFIFFVLGGILSMLVDIASMQALMHMRVGYGIAASVGFVVGLVVNYVCHARVTFKARHTASMPFRYGTVVLLNYLITMSLIVVAKHQFDSALVGKIISLPIVALNGFVLSRLWVFR
ncbi:GtrA-like protein [Ralstonia sp. 25mfcol4.1]|uniref:GtrA family protein n=1 Tax=Ralstonia sp. 25mfcol4.1 TaxID=1761899 RepID=UPI0003F86A6A|nr:GtrA family protein [Ralstonia sp. 25mfcol4.1]SDP57073.1 GtrA-like protein [Ralstonia sp. 25mfcol4.1]